MSATATTSKRGRKPTGTLVRNKTGYSAKVWAIVDGERIRITKPLGTDSLAAARKKLARLLGEADPEGLDLAAPETFEAAATRVYASRDTASAKHELSRLKRFAFPVLKGRRVTETKPTHVNDALEACKEAGKSRQTCQHLKQDISTVFAALKREGVIERNPVDDAEVPRYLATPKKERAVLTDEELGRYLQYDPPAGAPRKPVLERQVMACVARMFGGLRTGDLHAIRWETFDVPAFTQGWAPRQKSKLPQRLAVPEMLQPFLTAWWRQAGEPLTGPVFPARRGEAAGKHKRKASHAKAFRRDLQRAFGLEAARVKEVPRKNGRPRLEVSWYTARPMTAREHELFEVTPQTLPVDFHSWRRAYSQALGDAGVNAQQAKALAGHATMAAHERYLASANKLRVLPPEALPKLGISQIVRNEDFLRSEREGKPENS